MDEESPFLYDLAKELMPIKLAPGNTINSISFDNLIEVLGLCGLGVNELDLAYIDNDLRIKLTLYKATYPMPKNLRLLFDCYENDDKSILITKLRKE